MGVSIYDVDITSILIDLRCIKRILGECLLISGLPGHGWIVRLAERYAEPGKSLSNDANGVFC